MPIDVIDTFKRKDQVDNGPVLPVIEVSQVDGLDLILAEIANQLASYESSAVENLATQKPTTTELAEGTNLYFTEARALAAMRSKSVTYAQLTDCIAASTLIAGQQYTLSDYCTTHTIPGTGEVNIGPLEPLLLLATGLNTLAPMGYSTTNLLDIIYYTVNNADPRLPGASKGFVYRRIDTQLGNDIEADFRVVKFRRWLDEKTSAYTAVTSFGPNFLDGWLFEPSAYAAGNHYGNRWGGFDGSGSVLDSINMVSDATSKIYNNTLTNSTISNNTLTDNSYLAKNTLTNSYLDKNTLTNSYLANNTLTNSYISGSNLAHSTINNNTLTSSYIDSSTLTDSYIANNTLTNSYISLTSLTSSYINDNTLTRSSSISSSNLTNSSINGNNAQNSSYINNNTLTTDDPFNNNSINNNTLTNSSYINGNTLTNSSYINGNTLTNTSYINDNTLTRSSYINDNTLTNTQSVPVGTTKAFYLNGIYFNLTPRNIYAVPATVRNAVRHSGNSFASGDLTAYNDAARLNDGAPPRVSEQAANILAGNANVAVGDTFNGFAWNGTTNSSSAYRFSYERRNDGTNGWTRALKS